MNSGLIWPDTLPRTPKHTREAGRFKANFQAALKNVQTSLRMFGLDSGKPIVRPTLSTAVDMLGQNPSNDPGVACWFEWDGMTLCIACDRYSSTAANLQAIHHIIEARRVEMRHGSLQLVRASFQGFKALPAPNWRAVLDYGNGPAIGAEIEKAYRQKARTAHPDAGGTADAMAAVNAARVAGLKEAGCYAGS